MMMMEEDRRVFPIVAPLQLTSHQSDNEGPLRQVWGLIHEDAAASTFIQLLNVMNLIPPEWPPPDANASRASCR